MNHPYLLNFKVGLEYGIWWMIFHILLGANTADSKTEDINSKKSDSSSRYYYSSYLRPPDFQHRPIIGRPPPPPSYFPTTPPTTTIRWYWTSKTTPSPTPAPAIPIPPPVHVDLPIDQNLPATIEPPLRPTVVTESPADRQNQYWSWATTARPIPTTTQRPVTYKPPKVSDSRVSHERVQYNYPDGTFFFEYLDANGELRREQGYWKGSQGTVGRIFVQQGSYVVVELDGSRHRLSYIADEKGYRTSEQVVARSLLQKPRFRNNKK